MNSIATTSAQHAYSEAALALLQPIAANAPAGEDLTYSLLFDQIREARRADDAGLMQGEWKTEIKAADWREVRALCGTALQSQTKDLQVVAWFVEASVHLQGFAGLATGLEVMRGVLDLFWETAYPAFSEGDLDERIGKFEWLNNQIVSALKQVPMTSSAQGAYSWLQWQESRSVENLGLKDAKAKASAIADGKLSADVFDRAARESGSAFYQRLSQETEQASAALAQLTEVVDRAFGNDAPALGDLRTALDACAQLAARLYTDISGKAPMVVAPTAAPTSKSPAQASPVAVTARVEIPGVGPLNSRDDAIRALRDAASYFRANEPQSPVAPLAERAAKWAEMSIDEWLASVVKDGGTLAQLRELLDIKSPS